MIQNVIKSPESSDIADLIEILAIWTCGIILLVIIIRTIYFTYKNDE